ncbi:MAG: GNAT family N-acetyltransferase [Pseudomonadota bacterium]
MAEEINIRRGNSMDFESLGELVHAAIHDGAVRYTHEQRRAWSPAPRSADAMADRFGNAAVWVAEIESSRVGLMTLDGTGYIDFAYISPQWQGQGVFRTLYEAVEFQARANSVRRLSTHASLHAFQAFGHFGFNIVKPETVDVSGVWLPRFFMEKCL